ESKCGHVDKSQVAALNDGALLEDPHFQALVALHRTLLHEHHDLILASQHHLAILARPFSLYEDHDFFLTSQYSMITQGVPRNEQKCTMPARMWKHGIHSFLELLHSRVLM
ncbi:hypothetical protein EJ06DRAFT_576685, partial [Trichodelitschia bisporula]